MVYSKFTISVLLILVGLFSMSVFERFTALHDIANKRAQKEDELNTLKERATVLESKVEYLQKGRGVEEELRNRFDVAKEGEQAVVIVGDEEETIDVNKLTEPPGSGDEKMSIWELLKFW